MRCARRPLRPIGNGLIVRNERSVEEHNFAADARTPEPFEFVERGDGDNIRRQASGGSTDAVAETQHEKRLLQWFQHPGGLVSAYPVRNFHGNGAHVLSPARFISAADQAMAMSRVFEPLSRLPIR